MLPILTGGERIPFSLTTSHPAAHSSGAKQMKRKSHAEQALLPAAGWGDAALYSCWEQNVCVIFEGK